ncbi:MAG: hypothetical protein IJS28_06575 [Synergistaceae bacterium]|nr:hypothetical protein [Synergistaceae bacterium]
MIAKLYEHLRDEVSRLSFPCMVYNPLNYAWDGFMKYLALLPEHPRVVFLGMNPGPWGMAQTGIPFGEIEAVREFLGIKEIRITPPQATHPSYPVRGLQCSRSEVSGKRLWGLFRERFGSAEVFFREHAVLNYCPLMFLNVSADGRARNLTPDRLAKSDREGLFALCDECLRKVIASMRPEVVVGVGSFAESRARESLQGLDVRVVKILHPSPASPASNNGWAGKVTGQLIDLEVWQ